MEFNKAKADAAENTKCSQRQRTSLVTTGDRTTPIEVQSFCKSNKFGKVQRWQRIHFLLMLLPRRSKPKQIRREAPSADIKGLRESLLAAGNNKDTYSIKLQAFCKPKCFHFFLYCFCFCFWSSQCIHCIW